MDKGLKAAGMLKEQAPVEEEDDNIKEEIEKLGKIDRPLGPNLLNNLEKPSKKHKSSINAIDLSTMGQNMKSFSQIQNQIDILQNLLPKITDVGQRAGLIEHMVPKIESAMNDVEKKIKTKEKQPTQ